MAKKTEQKNIRTVANPGGIIKNPRVTEKATMISESAVYTFDVAADATKPEIKKAVNQLFKVEPVKINIVNFPRKAVFVRGKRGVRGGGKKAYVFLKKGETIDLA